MNPGTPEPTGRGTPWDRWQSAAQLAPLSLVAASLYHRRMHARTLITAVVTVLASACTDEPTSSIGQSALCPPAPCSSCDLGYYGPSDIPANASLVRIESNSAAASVTVWFRAGTADTPTPTTAPTLPAELTIPAGTTSLVATTSHGSVIVTFDGCN